MTATSIGYAGTTSPLQPETWRFVAAGSPSSGTANYSRSGPAWIDGALRQAFDLVNRHGGSPRALERFARWVGPLSIAVPRPFLAVGDDGSIGLEWSQGAAYLYLTFGEDEDGAFHQAPDGEEWEMVGPFNAAALDAALRVFIRT